MKRTDDKWALPLILGLYLLLGISYTLSNPILESPDELLNYENIRFIVEKRTLPVLHAGEFSKAHHPPLYYVMGAVLAGWVPNQHLEELAGNSNPFWGYRNYEQGVDNKSQYLHDPALEGWPYRDAVLGIRLLRLVSLLMGAAIVVIVYATTRALFREEPALAWSAAAVVAFNPMFLFIQGSVHNDTLTNLLAALTIYGIVRYWEKGPSAARAAFIGLAAGLGILTKITFLFLGPAVALALVARCWKDRQTNRNWWRLALKMLAIGGGIVLLIAGWWFVRNQILYGDPTSMKLQASIWQPRENAPDFVVAFDELSFLRDSFWGAFGFGQLLLHRSVYTLLWIMDLLAVGGLLLWAMRARKAHETYRGSALLLGVLLIAPLTAFAATFARMTVSGSANFGRYLFTSYAVIAPLLLLGWTEWIPERWRRPFVAGLTTFFFALAVYGLTGVLRPAYAAPPFSTGIDQVEISHPREDVYPGLANLLGFEFSPDSAVPGERFEVTLIWQVTGETEENNSLFVQLVDNNGERIAGRDTHPGLGRYPTSRWQQGEIIQDSIPLYLPSDAAGPQGLSLNIGLRDENGDLLFTENGQDTITLTAVRLAAAETVEPVGSPVQYYLGESVELVGAEIPLEAVRAGEEIPFTLTWRASASPAVDYVVFVHLVDENGELVATFDQPPAAGAYPTHLWQQGDTVIDPRLIQLPDELEEGSYDLLVGWYRLDDLTRLPVMNDQGQMLNESSIPLFSLDVTR